MKEISSKKISIFLILILCAGSFYTVQGVNTSDESDSYKLTSITFEQANIIAENSLLQLTNKPFFVNESNIDILHNDRGTILCYFISLEPNGYIVISSYYELPAVIAYSFTHKNEKGNLYESEFKSFLINDVTSRVTQIDKLPITILNERRNYTTNLIENEVSYPLFEQWPPIGSTPTEGWVETTWSQNAPYNNFCPIDHTSGQRSLAGCPAVAMAQIINYHDTINLVDFSDADDYYHNYAGNSYWIDDDYQSYEFPSFPQLNSYLSTLEDHYINEIPLTDTDKAALTFACGVAATQVYNPSGSGTFGVDQAYDAYLKFNINSIDLLDENDADIYIRLSNNMKNATPAHLAIVNEEWTSGHNLVVDGYNTNDFYHLNFGWGGSYDGWYLLPDELPFELTVIEGIILDINIDGSILDIDQSTYDRGFPIRHAVDGDWAAAQSFTPTINTLARAEILLRKFGTPEFNLTAELRIDGPQGTLIDSLNFVPSDVPSNWEWFTLNFTDVPTTPGTDYFIVIPPAPSGVTTSFGYEWGYAFGDQYPDGAFWFTRDGGALWRDLPTMYEFAFKTYGYY